MDQRLIQEVRSRGGRILNVVSDSPGWPEYRSGPILPDTDLDGMPDDWEYGQGLDPQDPSDSPQHGAKNDYTNLERYLNSIVAQAGTACDSRE